MPSPLPRLPLHTLDILNLLAAPLTERDLCVRTFRRLQNDQLVPDRVYFALIRVTMALFLAGVLVEWSSVSMTISGLRRRGGDDLPWRNAASRDKIDVGLGSGTGSDIVALALDLRGYGLCTCPPPRLRPPLRVSNPAALIASFQEPKHRITVEVVG